MNNRPVANELNEVLQIETLSILSFKFYFRFVFNLDFHFRCFRNFRQTSPNNPYNCSSHWLALEMLANQFL